MTTKRKRTLYLSDEAWACLERMADEDDRSASTYLDRMLLRLCEGQSPRVLQPVESHPVRSVPKPNKR